MSLTFFHKNHLDISDQMDFPSELLNLPASSENYILVVGPDLVKRETASGREQRNTYVGRLLEKMVAWCVQNNVIQQQDIIDELRTLLSSGALVPAGYKIEEYL